MPLRRKLLSQIAAVLLVSLLVGALLSFAQGRSRIDVEMNAAIAVAQVTLRDSLSGLASTPDPSALLKAAVLAFDGDRHLAASWIDADNKVRARSEPRAAVTPAPSWFAAAYNTDPIVTSVKLNDASGRWLGRIEVASSAANELSELWEDVRIKLAIFMTFFSLVVGLMYASVGRALKPLEDLSHALQRVSDGDFSTKVAERGPTELTAIYRAFNAMSGKLNDFEMQNARLTEQLATVQEEERAEIARDLHDEIGPFLFAVDADADIIKPLLDRGKTDDVKDRAAAIRQSVRHMQGHIKSILGRLKLATLVDLGLPAAVDHLTTFWNKRFPHVTFDTSIPDTSYGIDIDTLLFRVIQEGTSNAIRHGNPTRVHITLNETCDGVLILGVEDDGAGLERGLTRSDWRGFGLSGMRERLALLGGDMTLAPNDNGRGVRLRVQLKRPTAPPLDTTASRPTVH